MATISVEERNSDTNENSRFRFSKIRILAAVLIFAAFIYCDRMQVEINSCTTKDLFRQIEKTISLEKIMRIYDEELSLK